MKTIQAFLKDISERPPKNREKMEELREKGLILLHEGLLYALNTGCKPHEQNVWQDSIKKLEEAYSYFEQAATPGLQGGFTSNLRLAAISLLEATSMRIDAGEITNEIFGNAQLLLEIFQYVEEPLGVMAAKTVLFINNRSMGLKLSFNLHDLLLLSTVAFNVNRIQEIVSARACDIANYSDLAPHAFPEREILSLAILHKSLPFHSWQRIYENYQRSAIPHFELEIASVLIAYVIAVATAVTSNVVIKEVRDWIERKRKIEEKIHQIAKEVEIEDKLTYLLKGYSLREFHLNNPKAISLEDFNVIWNHLRNNESIPTSQEKVYKKYMEFRDGLPLELRNECYWIMSRLEEIITGYFIKDGEMTNDVFIAKEKLVISKPILKIKEDIKNLYAVCIGINKYRDDDIHKLNFARNDALEFAELLKNNFPKASKNIKILLDEEATGIEIKELLEGYLKNYPTAEDIVIIFYSGHGSPELFGNDKISRYLVPYDAIYDKIIGSCISLENFDRILEKIKAKQIIVLMDCCFSGRAGGKTFKGSNAKDAVIPETNLIEMISGEGRVIVCAAKDTEIAFEHEKIQHGIFTYSLLQGLCGNATQQKDRTIKLTDLLSFIEAQVPAKCKELETRTEQHPVYKGYNEHIILPVLKKS